MRFWAQAAHPAVWMLHRRVRRFLLTAMSLEVSPCTEEMLTSFVCPSYTQCCVASTPARLVRPTCALECVTQCHSRSAARDEDVSIHTWKAYGSYTVSVAYSSRTCYQIEFSLRRWITSQQCCDSLCCDSTSKGGEVLACSASVHFQVPLKVAFCTRAVKRSRSLDGIKLLTGISATALPCSAAVAACQQYTACHITRPRWLTDKQRINVRYS